MLNFSSRQDRKILYSARLIFSHPTAHQTNCRAVAARMNHVSLARRQSATAALFFALFLESKVAGIAAVLAVYHALRSAIGADLVVIYGGIQGLCLLQALAANGGFQVVA